MFGEATLESENPILILPPVPCRACGRSLRFASRLVMPSLAFWTIFYPHLPLWATKKKKTKFPRKYHLSRD